ncbi:hypothetical protein BKA82DRAFT_4179692 [Pisolithus tinctorius]|nr:hypothetical protein BKA82DRAFT_4213881 [Pisolithus tinctorius]KAI6144037.1 hypothetical protein BKA82DRAFT_4179692 [Pisolithus tinctorius]
MANTCRMPSSISHERQMISTSQTMASNTDTSRHLDFWVNTVTFSVENCLFRVPREPFQRESKFFCDKFSSLQGDSGEVEGLSDEKPIQLEGVEKNDFEQLLKVLFHRTHTLLPDLSLSTDQWKSVLSLSTAWTAIDALTKEASAVDRVVLSKKYKIEEWFLPALNELVKRREPITMEEAVQIGLEIGFTLACIRERLAMQKVNSGRGKRAGNRPEVNQGDIDFSDQIRVAFGRP